MKAKLHFDSFGDVKHLPEAEREKHPVPHHAPLPAGTIIDHPEAWKLVRNGHADPADPECAQKAGMTADELREAKRRHQKIAVGRGTGIATFDGPAKPGEEKSLADLAVSE